MDRRGDVPAESAFGLEDHVKDARPGGDRSIHGSRDVHAASSGAAGHDDRKHQPCRDGGGEDQPLRRGAARRSPRAWTEGVVERAS
jgi:hypothetical protein